MCPRISNVNISILFRSPHLIFHFIEIAKSRNIEFSAKHNFLVIRDRPSITVFEKEKNIFHVNVTDIKEVCDVKSSIDWVIRNYCPIDSFTFVKYILEIDKFWEIIGNFFGRLVCVIAFYS